MLNRILTASIALLFSLAAAGCDHVPGDQLGPASELRCGDKDVETVEATPELINVFEEFQFELALEYEGPTVKWSPNLDASCIDGQTHEVSSKSGHEFEEDGVIYYVTYTIVTQWTCVEGQWVETGAYCPVDQPCFSVEEVGAATP